MYGLYPNTSVQTRCANNPINIVVCHEFTEVTLALPKQRKLIYICIYTYTHEMYKQC